MRAEMFDSFQLVYSKRVRKTFPTHGLRGKSSAFTNRLNYGSIIFESEENWLIFLLSILYCFYINYKLFFLLLIELKIFWVLKKKNY